MFTLANAPIPSCVCSQKFRSFLHKAFRSIGPETVSVKEGKELVLRLRREGSGSDTTSVNYKTRQRGQDDSKLFL